MTQPSLPLVLKLARLRATRDFLPPALLALAACYWLNVLTHVYVLMPLGGDQGIFQYIASALRHGDVMYRDIREVNGPGTAIIHVVMQWLGGRDPQVFRWIDLNVSIAAFATFGALMPGLVGSSRARDLAIAPSRWARAGWAIAAVSVLLTGYMQFDFWSTAQRESFGLWFLLPSVALQMNAHASFRGESPARAQTRQRNLLIAAGVLTSITWFIKPTFGLFALVQVATLLVGAPIGGLARWRRVLWFGASASVSALLIVLLLTPVVDFGGWLAQLAEGMRVYRYMWNRAIPKIWTSHEREFAMAHAIAFLGVLGVWSRALPARMLCVALMPLAGALHLTLQHKGFSYHYLPLVQLVRAALLVLVAFVAELSWHSIRERRVAFLVATLPLMWLASETAEEAARSASMKLAVLLESETVEPAAKIGSAEYYALFDSRHTPFAEQEAAAAYLKRNTTPHDRIQVYGRDPWVLYLAERLSATPFMYITDFNMSRAVSGSGYAVPTEAERKEINAAGHQHDQLLATQLLANPPSHFVFINVEGLIRVRNAPEDFVRNAPRSGLWLTRNYEQDKVFGPITIWRKKSGATLR